jgi:hypothetical protein
MSRKFVLTLATAAALAVSALATTAADAHGFGGGGGHGGGFGHGGGGGGFGRVGGGHFGGFGHVGRISMFHFGGHNPGRDFGHGQHWAHWHWPHHHRWFWRDGRWVYLDGYDGGYAEPVNAVSVPAVSTPGPCTCLTKSYTQDGMVVFADLCTKESAAAPVDGRAADARAVIPQESAAPPRAVEDKASEAPTQSPSNFAGRTYKDFLLANGLPLPQGLQGSEK